MTENLLEIPVNDEFVNQILDKPEKFILPDAKLEKKILEITKNLFDFGIKYENNSSCPLEELYIEGFDNEQIWEEIQLQNVPLIEQFNEISNDIIENDLQMSEDESEVNDNDEEFDDEEMKYKDENLEEDDEEEENRDIIITTDGEDQNKNQKQNENENHIQSEEEGDPKQKLLQGSPQHTYETFSDNQQIPIQPPPSNSPKNNIYSTADNDSLSSSVISKCSNQSSNIQMTSENSLKEEPKKEDLESKPKVELEKEEEPKQEPEPESKPESKPEPEEIVEKKESPKESVSETKYETFDEISQKQKLDIPVFEIPSNIKKDSNENSYSTSVSNSISKANIRSNKSNDSQESLNNSSNSSSNSSSNNDEDDDGDECEKSNDNSPEDSISGDVSQLSIDTRDENEEGDKESKSPLNKKSKKKSKKGKKGKKGKKNKRGRGLATQIQTVLLLSLFILQIQARALDYTGKLEGFNHQSNLGLNPDEYPKICNESPNLTLGQKIFGSLMAWSSGLLYFTCRIPQILENKRNRSVEGLSILLFICTILGNFFYGLSILIRFPPINTKFFTGTLPYLIGSVGTFIFDVMIIYQFNAYKPSNSHYERIE